MTIMKVRTLVFVEMNFLLFLCPALLAAGVLTLTIDSGLGIPIEDCFERITIGEQLPPSAIYRNVSELTTRECEQICKQDKQCQTYDYGVGAKGNATCNLSKYGKELRETKFIRNPDYDIYIRRDQCEQSAPIKLQPQFDEPVNESLPGSGHRPVFRPVAEEPKRPEDQNFLPGNFRPNDRPTFYRPKPQYHDGNRPVYGRPETNHIDDKPSVYGNRGPYRPVYGLRPDTNHIDDRPDDYNQRPVNDQHLGYGQHQPQDIIFQRPQRPFNDQAVPQRPFNDQFYGNSRPKPDPYDILQFQDPYDRWSRPYNPGYWRPDPYCPPSPDDEIQDIYGQKPNRPDRPIRPNDYTDGPRPGPPERPIRPIDDRSNYNYINRPKKPNQTQLPRPQDSFGYSSIKPDHGTKQSPSYGQNDDGQQDGLVGPPSSYRPEIDEHLQKPQKPSYSYTAQFASNHGQSSHYDQGNGIIVEIHDPIIPYKPPRRLISDSGYGNQGFRDHQSDFGYGSQSYQQQSQNQYYGSSLSNGYGQSQYGTTHNDYGQNNHIRPHEDPIRPQRPTHGVQGSNYGSLSSNYGSQSHILSSQYGSQNDNYFKPQNLGNYGSSQNTGGGQSGYHFSDQGTYSSHGTTSQSYGTTQSNGTTFHISSQYGHEDRPAQEYNNDPSSDIEDTGYKNNEPNKKGQTTKNNNNYRPESGYHRPDTGTYRPENGNHRPETGYPRAETGNHRPETGNPRPEIDNHRPESGNHRPINQSAYERPNIKPVYEHANDRPYRVPSYQARPSGEVVTSGPVAVSDYGTRPGISRNPGHEVSYKACYRRVLAGKRAARSHVRRVIPCERLEDCRRECAEERTFHCESFNYKLDPSFRGKGLCELMTKPIEAFDLHHDFIEDKDFDFFELDRNSLEPDCPETLKGPGRLHSGFLSSKPDSHQAEGQTWDRYDSWSQNQGGYDRRYQDDRRRYKNQGGRRRYEDQLYIPYQIGLARSDDEAWGQYGGSYGGDGHYKNRHDLTNSLNHWQISRENLDRSDGYGVKTYPVRKETYPVQKETYPVQEFNYHTLGRKFTDGTGHWRRGSWNGSGDSTSGLSYGESKYYRPRVHVERPPEVPVVKDCSSRRQAGMSLGSGAIRRSLLADNVVGCEAACFSEGEFKCVSYSYRYSNSHGTDNCFLSERPYRGLDLAADSGSDVYAMPVDHGCPVNQTPWVESECFWHVRSESAVSGDAVKSALTVAGLGACEAECIRAHGFFCRGFSFRFDAPAAGDNLENCLLTSSPPTSLHAGAGLRNTPGHELYSRGNYGRGCEPATYDAATNQNCYLQYDNAAKLIGPAVKGHARVKDEEACGQACTDAPFRCLSFSYNNAAPPDADNCLLSEVRLFDLQRGVDYEHSQDDWLFAFNLFNSQCWRRVHGKDDHYGHHDHDGHHDHHDHSGPSQELPHPVPPSSLGVVPGSGPPSGSGYLPTGPPAGPGTSYGSDGPSGPSYIPVSAPSGPSYKPDYPSGPSYQSPPYPERNGPFKPALPPPEYQPTGPYKPTYGPPNPDPPYGPFKPNYGPPNQDPPYGVSGSAFGSGGSNSGPGYGRPSGPGYGPPDSGPGFRPGYVGDRADDEPIIVSWRHYTVSGFPCRKGTACDQNQVDGHWACEPEGGEIGSWDYCCAPTHRCGYSEGFHKPWCYVGQATEQWRPCSDKYYPYHQHDVPHPSQGLRAETSDIFDGRSQVLYGNRIGPPHSHEPSRPSYNRPAASSYLPLQSDERQRPGHTPGPYLPEADRKYWDNLYRDGPQAYYDNHGNPLPGYARVPMSDRPHIRYQHNHLPGPSRPSWEPVLENRDPLDPPIPGGLGAARYWPVAYLHKGPPPNMTYFRYNETKQQTTTQKIPILPTNLPRIDPPPEFNRPINKQDRPIEKPEGRNREEKNRNMTENLFKIEVAEVNATTSKAEVKELVEVGKNKSEVEVSTAKNEVVKAKGEVMKGINGKLDDFSGSIEILDIEDAKKGEKQPEVKTLEAEERQIEAIGRLLASRRGGKLILEKRSQKDLEAKSIAIDKDLLEEFDFGNRFSTTERKGIIQKVTKEQIKAEREANNDKSLEVSETTFVRPPRVLSTTENIRKALINGKVFYDATVREQRDLFANHTRKINKTPFFRPLEESKAPSVLTNQTYGKKKNLRVRNVNPVRRVRRIYKKIYNPEEVRRRLLERERSKQDSVDSVMRKT